MLTLLSWSWGWKVARKTVYIVQFDLVSIHLIIWHGAKFSKFTCSGIPVLRTVWTLNFTMKFQLKWSISSIDSANIDWFWLIDDSRFFPRACGAFDLCGSGNIKGADKEYWWVIMSSCWQLLICIFEYSNEVGFLCWFCVESEWVVDLLVGTLFQKSVLASLTSYFKLKLLLLLGNGCLNRWHVPKWR